MRGYLPMTRAHRLNGLLAMTVSGVVLLLGGPAQARSVGPGRDPSWVRAIGWSSTKPAPGVRLLSGTFSDPSVHPQWTVTVQAPTVSPLDGSAEYAEAGSASWAEGTESELSADGFASRADRLYWPRYADDPRGVLGSRVRVGEFATQSAAQAAAAQLTADGFHVAVEWEGFDPQHRPDIELLHAAIVDPRRFTGGVVAYHGDAVASRQTVAAHAQQLHSLAAAGGHA